MADNKKILIDIQANTSNFVRELNEVNRLLSTVASTFSVMSNKIEGGFADVASSSTSANRSLSAIENTIGKLVGEIKTLNSTSGSSSRAIDDLSSSTSRSAISFNKAGGAMNMFMKNMSPTQIQRSVDAVDRLNSSFHRLGGMLPPIGRAFEWNLAYDLVHAPGRAIGAASRKIKQTIDETSSLEGEIYDLEAFLGGAGGVELTNFAKSLGKTGTDEQLKDIGLQELQNKILAVGQESTFTAMQIAQATTEAAKAGVSIQEIAGPTGTALDAINLLAQNTGESLETSATSLAKLQNLFENNLSKTQVAFGQTADTGKQFQIIVDGLATADMSASATASELTQALFNVGGSAQNLNMSFFETVSLVSSMVPAFESAASAGTSLKYMFSALTGGRSVKAQGALKELGLMDEYGQTVFFDDKGFKGLDFMVNQLRAVFGDEGMAVDVRNRLITDIFGQDALKAVSRLVSMTDEQTMEMLEMSAQLQANAAAGVQSAVEVAAIKNEGLEYDFEVLTGTMDSLAKTLTMPLLKPMSNFVQTLSNVGNAAFEVMTGAGSAEEVFKNYASGEVFQKSMLPGALSLLEMVTKYAEGLGVALKVVTEQGWNMQTLGTAVAALLGTPVEEIETRAQSLAEYFAHLYESIANFIVNLPGTIQMIGDGINYGFDKFMTALDWLQTNWDGIIDGVKTFAIAWAAFQGLQVVSTLISIASGVSSLVASLGGISGIIASISGAFTAFSAAVSGFFLVLFPNLLGGPRALFFSAAWRTALLLDIGTWMSAIVGFLTSPWLPIIATVGAFVAMFMNNTNGLRDFIMERFGNIGTYLIQTWEMISGAVINAWNRAGELFQEVSKLHFVDGIANMFKGVFQVLEGAVVVIGGILKVIVGIFTLNMDVIRAGASDMLTGVGTAIMGVFRALGGAFQGVFVGAIEAVNKVLQVIGLPAIQIDAGAANDMFEQYNDYADNEGKGWRQVGASTATSASYNKDAIDFFNNGNTENSSSTVYKYGEGVGRNLNYGIASGLSSTSDLPAEAMLEVTGDVKNAVTTEFIIKSPSQWMFNQGVLIAEGLANGIASSYQMISNAVSHMVSPINDIAVPNKVINRDAIEEALYFPAVSPFNTTTSSSNMPETPFIDPKLYNQNYGAYSSAGNVIPSQYADYVEGYQADNLLKIFSNSRMFVRRFGEKSEEEIQKMLTRGYAYGSDLDAFGNVRISKQDEVWTRDPVQTILDKMGFKGNINDYVASGDYALALERIDKGTTSLLDNLANVRASTGPIFSNSGVPVFSIPKSEADANEVTNLFNSSENKNIKNIIETGITGVFEAIKPKDLTKDFVDDYFVGDSGKIRTTFNNAYEGFTTSIVKSTKVIKANSEAVGDNTRRFVTTYDTGTGYRSTDGNKGEIPYRQLIDMGTIGAQYAIETMTMNAGEGGKVNYNNDPYGYGEQLARASSTVGTGASGKVKDTVVVTQTRRQLTPSEVNAINPDQPFLPVMHIPQAATFDSIPNLHGYSTDTFDVAKSAKGFQMAYGDKGIAQRGLTDFFKERPQAYETFNEIGNRAATFLSLKRGKLTPEDVVLYKKYLAQDKADRQAYLEAAKTTRDEIAATNADASLTPEEKKQRNQASMGRLNKVGDPLTSGFTDVYGLKVGSFNDYSSGAYNVPEEMKQYTDPIFGSVNDAIFEAVANSEEFQKLPQDQQERIIKAAQQMPLQSMAMLSDALMDGVLDSDEVQNIWTYAGEDIATIRNMISEGRAPTAADKNLAYTPYIDGIATFTRREDISGDLAQSMFMGWDNIVNVQFAGSGQQAWKAFSEGWDASSGGSPLTIADVMSFDPAQIQKLNDEAREGGKGVGESMQGGVYEGLSANDAVMALLKDMFGVDSGFLEIVKNLLDAHSPSDNWQDLVGVPMMQGIVEGIKLEKPNVLDAIKNLLFDTEKVGGKEVKFPIFKRLGFTAGNQFVNGFSGKGNKNNLNTKLQNEIMKATDTEQPTPEMILLMERFKTFGGKMGDEFNKGFALYIREYAEADTEGMTFSLALAASYAAPMMGEKFKEVGKSAVDGIKLGIEDPVKYQELKGALETLAAKMVADAKTAINSSSPSKLFASEVGSPIVEGIAMGIANSSGVVSNALSKVTAGNASYRPGISSVALNGASNRVMSQNNNYSYNYNLGVTTNQSPSVVKRSFAVMKSFKGDI